jgi:hypothetical protein
MRKRLSSERKTLCRKSATDATSTFTSYEFDSRLRGLYDGKENFEL